MKTLELKETTHRYFCSESNYYSNECFEEFKSFEEFLEESKNEDIDLNLIFRFDIYKNEESNSYELWLFYILQRKGIFYRVTINEIKKSDMKNITKFLKKHYLYNKNQWKEFIEN